MTRSRSMYYVICGKVLVNIVFQDAKKNYLTLLQQGENLVHLINRFDELHCFRLHKDCVFYAPESSMKLAISVARPYLVSPRACSGKFSKSGKFKLHVTSLDYLAQYAKYKASITFKWIARCITEKIKAHLGQITEDTPEHQGVIVYSIDNTPLVR